MTVEEALDQAARRLASGELAAAGALYHAILAREPGRADALRQLALVEARSGRPHRAAKLLERTVARTPDDPAIHLALARLRGGFGDRAAALRHATRAIQLDPGSAEGYALLARCFYDGRQYRDAESVARRSLGINPDLTDARFTLGSALAQQGRLAEAGAAFRQVVTERPGSAPAHFYLAGTTDDPAAAAASYRQALALDPTMNAAHAPLGLALRAAGDDAAAIAHLRRASEVAPREAAAWADLGAALLGIDRAEAIRCLDRALFLQPHHLDALRHRIELLQADGEFEAARAMFGRLVEALPAALEREQRWQVLAGLMYLDATMKLPRGVRERLLVRLDGLLAGRVAAFGPLGDPVRPAADSAPRRIRLGYLSACLGDHPIGHVTLSLFPAHDRVRFELHGFSLRDRTGEVQPFAASLRDAFDQFHQIGRLSPREAARAIRAAEIDIVVDLDGYIAGLSPEILAYRPAPLQVAVLANATGLNLSCLDYLVADRIIVPPGEEGLHRERIVRLSGSFHCADRHAVATPAPSRAACGLPTNGFVFGVFARPDKLDAHIVACWLRILQVVEGSVLWLAPPSAGASLGLNLRQRAVAAGIDPGRLIFAERVADKAVHLARLSRCDLLLDTAIFSAATTALDALWAGVPVLALTGDHEPNRIAASILSALDMPELICATLDDYERRAIALAQDPAALAMLRDRLAIQRGAAPLFDIAGFVRSLEQAYEQMWGRYLAGHPPEGFDLALRAGSPLSLSAEPDGGGKARGSSKRKKPAARKRTGPKA